MSDSPIYLCTQQELVGDASDGRAVEQLELLASIVAKLGYQLMSGEAPRFHELWARPQPQAQVAPSLPADAHRGPVRDIPAEAFERRFLAWIHISFGIFPERQAGTNAFWWKFTFNDSDVEAVIVGQRKNTATPPSATTEWLLRVEESEPVEFIKAVERHFTPGSGVRRRMSDGRTRMQFKSNELQQEFIDQTEGTD